VGERWGGYKELSGFAFRMGEVGEGEYAMVGRDKKWKQPCAINLVSRHSVTGKSTKTNEALKEMRALEGFEYSSREREALKDAGRVE